MNTIVPWYGVTELRNNYLAFRHGKSVPNERGIVLSDPLNGRLPEFGLVAEGRAQVRESVRQACRGGLVNSDTIIISSCFSRARESAEIAREILDCADITNDARLNERNFGNYEGWPNNIYEKIWKVDEVDPDHRNKGVESANQVRKRFLDLIQDCENNYQKQTIMLASHGDTLQIGETAFMKVPASRHRLLPHLETARIRQMIWLAADF